jgi:hypothetical protein
MHNRSQIVTLKANSYKFQPKADQPLAEIASFTLNINQIAQLTH